ncbi:MAG: hypothetical protein E6051_04125 [Citrobacter freundii]|uniref:hypothetical protein n=1 Tax=Enterobacteriaceae TaxID=543 RepID=UPI0024E0F4DB|nr:hypothetical protein [Citrobacter freundii]MDU5549005.1 hypothetical protein [Citrobacter freundii]MDU7218534.1 hypothetical protein [Citrobacter freundii]MDX7390667.1 hypothetical protein [Citrobacter freundii]WIJ19199.1 hypothetical protein QOK75_18865 [Citrobacter freundii]WOQ07742.1 hypothetical protein R2X30_22100 [Citrobacter freundii]
MAMTTCRKCGSKVERKAKKCPYCDSKRPGERWWHVVGGLVVLLIAVPSAIKSCSDQPESKAGTTENVAQYTDTTLKQWRKLGKDERLKFIDGYLTQANIPLSASGDFYNCISQHSFTKDDNVKSKEALDWCKQDYGRDPSLLANMVNFDTFMGNVRSFDSSYRPLTSAIKDNMNDPSSFKHIETNYRFVLSGSAPYAVVTTTYQGSNAYGATVKDSASAKVDLNTGNIVEYHQ